ncbi:hypothetical protein XarbCFBP8152_04165 [Xanthomonas arboricola]|nr:hypothetical protein XarbCFBP8152_04165 [Xanthomonas arboricola]
MPRKRLHGRTCGVSCDGGRTRALQQIRRSLALQPTHPHRSIPLKAMQSLRFSVASPLQAKLAEGGMP